MGGAEIFLKPGRKRDSREIIQHNPKEKVMKKTQTVHECRRSFEPTRNRVKIERGKGRAHGGLQPRGKRERSGVGRKEAGVLEEV